jgi:hypothetical protein
VPPAGRSSSRHRGIVHRHLAVDASIFASEETPVVRRRPDEWVQEKSRRLMREGLPLGRLI